jgi:ureidoglycolate amidohydrolase
MNIEINADRLAGELETLAGFSDAARPAVTRVVFTETDMRARRWVRDRFLEAGLEVREDAVGNTFARWEGREASLAAVGTGSHIDAIPNAGRFDGTVGVLGALEAVRSLRNAGFQPQRSIDIVLFTSEEPTRFGVGCLGSRLLSRALDADADEMLIDGQGVTLVTARADAGFTGDLDSVALPREAYRAFVELHIEQGPILEKESIALGVVTHIAAPAALRLTIEGEGGHAGAVLMPDRHDAFLAGAEVALAIEEAARLTGSIDTVATTGVCNIFPGAVNSIPSRVEMSVDIRDIDLERRDAVLTALTDACERVAKKRGVQVWREVVNADAPATCDPEVVEMLCTACEDEGLSFRRMISRAYHDSLFMSRICPTAMLFIPCRAGVSHGPDEFASIADIANGTRVLARAIARLAHD